MKLKLISGLDPERTASNTMDPSQWVQLLEELDLAPNPEWANPESKIVTSCNLKGQDMIQLNFGKWSPKGFDGIKAKCDTELEEMAAERGWDITPEETLASLVSVIQRTKELIKWKEEQESVRRAKHFEAFYKEVGTKNGKPVYHRFYTSHNREHTEKVLIDGKLKWNDATIYELPPAKMEDIWVGKTRKRVSVSPPGAFIHEDARYILKLPDGRKVDLGMTDGKWKPVKRNETNKAMQSIAARLGMKMQGGAHTILQTLLNRTDIIPAYTTFWHNEKWVVIVGWQKDPKLTPATYCETLEGKLVRVNNLPEDAKRLTVSEAEYKIISKPSIGEADDTLAMGNCSLELDSDMTMQGFERDGERFEVDTDQFTDGLTLLEPIAKRMDRYIEFMCGEPIWELPSFRMTLAEMCQEVRRERHELKLERKWLISKRTVSWLEKDAELANDLTKSINKATKSINSMLGKHLAKVKDMWKQLSSCDYTPVRYWYPNQRPSYLKMIHADYHKVPLQTTEAMNKSPLNIAILPPRLVYDVARVIPSITPLQALQAGVTGIVERAEGCTTRMLPRRVTEPTTPKNAPNRLRAVLGAMIAGESPLHA